jgi:hypothetical protein
MNGGKPAGLTGSRWSLPVRNPVTEVFIVSMRLSISLEDSIEAIHSHASAPMIFLARSTIHFVEISVFSRMVYVSGLHDAIFWIVGCT